MPSCDCLMKYLNLIKTDSLIKRLRWKIFHFENAKSDDNTKSDNNTKSDDNTKSDLALNGFRAANTHFQQQIKNISEIKREKVIMSADKTTNLLSVNRVLK